MGGGIEEGNERKGGGHKGAHVHRLCSPLKLGGTAGGPPVAIAVTAMFTSY